MRIIWLAAVLLTPACAAPVTACPAIAQAPVVTTTILQSYVPAVRTLHMKVCQSGTCREGDLELAPGTTPVDQRCEQGPESACSANASPDGTLTGHLWLDLLTENPIEATLSGSGADGSPLPVRTITFTPKLTECPKFITASLLLDADGVRQA
jgi:hypothetical protein